MSDFLLYIYPFSYILLIFFGSKVAKKGEFAEEPWNRQQALMLQAVACIGVVLHHVTQEVTGYGVVNKGPITIFNFIGLLFTSLFFFFSGYGLITSVRTKEAYLKTFLWKRLSVILVPFWVANIISVLVRIFYLQIPTKPADIIKCVLGWVLLNGNAWYIVEIFFLYLAFFVIFRLCKNQKVALILLSLTSLIPIMIGLRSGHDESTLGNHWFMGEWWYNSTIVFVMGLWVAHCKERVIAFAKKYYRILIIVSFILLVASYILEEYMRMVYGYYSVTPIGQMFTNSEITLVAQAAMCVIFTWVVLLINLKISLGNRLLKGISLISMEIFLLHGIFLKNIFSGVAMPEALLYIVVLLAGIIAAIIVHLLDKAILTCIHKHMERRNQKLSKYEMELRKAKKARRRKHIILCIIFMGMVVVIASRIYTSWIRPGDEYEKERKQLSQAKVGDVVTFGRYDTNPVNIGTERLQWIVLQKEENRLMLITKEGIAGSVYHQKHEEVSWEESDLCVFLNDTLYDEIFSRYEEDIIVDNPDSGDRLSLLSETEVETFFADDKSRQLSITDVARSKGTNVNSASKANSWDMKGYRSSWWWLRGSKESFITAPIVTEDGVILTDEKYVNKPNGAIRPVVFVQVK